MSDKVTELHAEPGRPRIEDAIRHIKTARRLVMVCSAAAVSDYQDCGEDIQQTLGVEVDTELGSALELLENGKVV